MIRPRVEHTPKVPGPGCLRGVSILADIMTVTTAPDIIGQSNPTALWLEVNPTAVSEIFL